MLNIATGRRIWLCLPPTDMRQSFDGLSAQVRRYMDEDPGQGDWFVFINRRRSQIKILVYEEGGYCLWSKRLERGLFALPSSADGVKQNLSRTALLALLEGIELEVKRQRIRYKRGA